MIKEKIQCVMRTFSLVTTCMVFAVAVFCTIINPTEKVSAMTLWQIPLVSMLTSLETLIYPWNRKMEKLECAVRIFIHYLMIVAVVLLSGWLLEWYDVSNAGSVALMIGAVTIIFAIVSAISWSASAKTAKLMNEKLQEKRKSLQKDVDKQAQNMYTESVRENKTREKDT